MGDPVTNGRSGTAPENIEFRVHVTALRDQRVFIDVERDDKVMSMELQEPLRSMFRQMFRTYSERLLPNA